MTIKEYEAIISALVEKIEKQKGEIFLLQFELENAKKELEAKGGNK